MVAERSSEGRRPGSLASGMSGSLAGMLIGAGLQVRPLLDDMDLLAGACQRIVHSLSVHACVCNR
jgi:hypothetical protein